MGLCWLIMFAQSELLASVHDKNVQVSFFYYSGCGREMLTSFWLIFSSFASCARTLHKVVVPSWWCCATESEKSQAPMGSCHLWWKWSSTCLVTCLSEIIRCKYRTACFWDTLKTTWVLSTPAQSVRSPKGELLVVRLVLQAQLASSKASYHYKQSWFSPKYLGNCSLVRVQTLRRGVRRRIPLTELRVILQSFFYEYSVVQAIGVS